MKKVDLLIDDFQTSVCLEPTFKKVVPAEEANSNTPGPSKVFTFHRVGSNIVRVNRSVCQVDIIIENTGDTDIADWEAGIRFPEGFSGIQNVTRYDDGYAFGINGTRVQFRSESITIVKDDNVFFSLSFRVPPVEKKYKLVWSFVSGEYREEGELPMEVEPRIVVEERYFGEENREPFFEDYFEELKRQEAIKQGCLFRDLR